LLFRLGQRWEREQRQRTRCSLLARERRQRDWRQEEGQHRWRGNGQRQLESRQDSLPRRLLCCPWIDAVFKPSRPLALPPRPPTALLLLLLLLFSRLLIWLRWLSGLLLLLLPLLLLLLRLLWLLLLLLWLLLLLLLLLLLWLLLLL
jgi:hypothetical protein